MIFKVEINKAKSESSSLRDEDRDFVHGVPTKEETKVLGTVFNNSWKKTQKLNWNEIRSIVKKAISYGNN